MKFPIIAAIFMLVFETLYPINASAIEITKDEKLEFIVLRDGSEIGSHSIDFRRNNDLLDVTIQTNIAVRIPLIYLALYHFDHRGHEVWSGGRLKELSSMTDDDGTKHNLKVFPKEAYLEVSSDIVQRDSDPSVIPASLWNIDLVHRSRLLNTLTGEEMTVLVIDKGLESIHVQDGDRITRHYAISGELERDVWYDDRDRLVQVRFTGKDGSEIQYIRK